MPRLRLAVGGAGPVEQWSVTAEFALGAAVPSLAVLQSIVNAVRTTLAASASFRAGFCTDSFLAEVKALHYPTVVAPADLVATAGGTPVAGVTGTVHAPQVCVVASLRSNFAGRSYRGRQYWPYRGGQVNAAGTVSAAGQTVINLAAQALSQAVVAACATQTIAATWVVYSPHLGTMSPIVQVLVGSQCDTQRRRNVNRAETYAANVVTSLEADESSLTEEEFKAYAASLLQPINVNPLKKIVQVLPLIITKAAPPP